MSSTLTPLPSPQAGLPTVGSGSKTWNVLPFPTAIPTSIEKPIPSPLPAWPDAPFAENPQFPQSWPSPIKLQPLPGDLPPQSAALHSTPSFPAASFSAPVTAEQAPGSSGGFPAFHVEPTLHSSEPDPSHSFSQEPAAPDSPDFTDDDLRIAFGPIVEDAVRKAVYAKENGIDTYLEPMLRATIRRALAEYAPTARPFQQPGTLDRFIWHVQALFTSRTYEDIFFEKTRRFQVEEVFLLDAASLALVSFASCDPARHSSVRRVSGTASRIALQLRDEKGQVRKSFELSDRRSVIARQGTHVILMAIVRGVPGELAYADLEFALRRIEDHFREQFQIEGSSLLFALQPFLEDCLLIQAPASAA